MDETLRMDRMDPRARAARARMMAGSALSPTPVDPRLRNPFQSPPGSGDNDGADPTAYDVSWQKFTNLKPNQITAFESFPQDLQYYATQKGWEFEQKGFSTSGINKTYVTAMRAAVDTLVAAINASSPTVTSRTQIDAALAAVPPPS